MKQNLSTKQNKYITLLRLTLTINFNICIYKNCNQKSTDVCFFQNLDMQAKNAIMIQKICKLNGLKIKKKVSSTTQS